MNSERPGSTIDIESATQERLLAWLGLPEGASSDDVQATHDRLLGFLDTAPLVLQPWARGQADAAKAARTALLEGDAPDASGTPTAAGTPPLGGEALPAAHFDDDVIDAADPVRRARSAQPRAAAPVAPAVTGKPAKNPTTILLLALLTVAVVIGVYFMGGGGQDSGAQSATPGAGASASAPDMGATPVPVDQAKVDEFEAKVKANPKDVSSMREIANIYFGAADFTNAAVWQNKVLEVTPSDTEARLALGAAKFNSGDMVEAEKQWREVLRLDAKNAEAHYNLGFLHLSATPPQIDKAEAEWRKVAELAPGSDIAKTATAHLDRLKNMPTVAPNPGTATTPAQGTP